VLSRLSKLWLNEVGRIVVLGAGRDGAHEVCDGPPVKRLRAKALRTISLVDYRRIPKGIKLVASVVLRKSAARRPNRALSRRLQFSLAAASATAIFAFGASGEIASAVATDEPAEPLPPFARTGFAFGVDKTGVVLVGFVNARGLSTTARFQIGKTKAYGRSYPSELYFSGYHASELEQGVLGLRPRTTYHFRLVATNDGGTTYGKDKTFRTLPR
jgi:hypothetical protein